MNINKFTQKSLQAVQGCEKTAIEYGNQEIVQEHLFDDILISPGDNMDKSEENQISDGNATGVTE